MSRLVAVAVPVPFLSALTYSVPAGMPLPHPGVRVRVPLGSRVVTGCVLADTPRRNATLRKAGRAS